VHTIYFYSAKSSPRLEYILDYIFQNSFSCNFVVASADDISDYPYKICYGKPIIYGAYSIPDIGLLWSEGTLSIKVDYEKSDHHFIFNKEGHDAPADIFSAIFFMLSRYEEYSDNRKDEHERCTAAQSFAFQHDFLEIPIVDVWLRYLQNALEKKFKIKIANKKEFEFVPTFDIDQVYLMHQKSIWRQFGTLTRSLLKLNFKYFKILNKKDPNDVYDWIIDFHTKNDLHPIFFFLLGDYHTYNPNHHYKNAALHEVIKKLQKLYRIGIHPSYLSMSNKIVLETEINRLQHITNEPVRISRQHFLRLNLPVTYQNLIEKNIRMDYTMGYADAVGFRAGTCNPYYWYDLQNECKTTLIIQPFVAMDVTLKNYMRLNPEKALVKLKELINICNQYATNCTVLWHNSALSEFEDWKNWKQVYIEMINFVNGLK
jgi:hypothetical protein